MIGWRKRKEKLVRGSVFVDKQDADANCLLASHSGYTWFGQEISAECSEMCAHGKYGQEEKESGTRVGNENNGYTKLREESRSDEEEQEATAESYDGGIVAMLPVGGNPGLKCDESSFILIFKFFFVFEIENDIVPPFPPAHSK